jgi:hypothetical protein
MGVLGFCLLLQSFNPLAAQSKKMARAVSARPIDEMLDANRIKGKGYLVSKRPLTEAVIESLSAQYGTAPIDLGVLEAWA